MTATLYTTQGVPFTLDDEDAPLVERFSWQLTPETPQRRSYVTTYTTPPGGEPRPIFLHHLIMGTCPRDGLLACNIRANPLCLEKSNLAWVDASILRHWTSKPRDPEAGYRGVCCRSGAPLNPWQMAFAKRSYAFPTAEQAALAYDEMARKRYGPWARVNFPRPHDPTPTGMSCPCVKEPLLGRDGAVLKLDQECLPLLSRHQWEPGPDGYWASISSQRIPLAYLVLGGPGKSGTPRIEWHDGDVRNCTRNNLAWRYVNTSSYRGVIQTRSRWLAKISINKARPCHLGIYDTPEEAARAYDKAAIQLLGPKARLNFPLEHKASQATMVGNSPRLHEAWESGQGPV